MRQKDDSTYLVRAFACGYYYYRISSLTLDSVKECSLVKEYTCMHMDEGRVMSCHVNVYLLESPPIIYKHPLIF